MSQTTSREPADGAPRYWAWSGSWRAILALAAGALAVRVAYLALLCPFTLVEDEAHYWEWSRRLDWSYYSKGPGVAWAIAAATRTLGASEAAVRLPAAVFASVLIIGVAGLASDVARDRRAGFVAGLLTLLVPMLMVAGLLMTVDMPYVAMWTLGAWAGWRAIGRGSRWAWPALGAAVGIGFLFKYTILLLVPGIALFVLLGPRRRALAARRSGWVAASLALMVLGLVPVLIWNSAHGWVTVRHLLGHLGLAGGDMPGAGAPGGWDYDPRWTLEFVVMQMGMMSLPLLLCVFAVIEAVQRRREDPARWAGQLYLICCASPILIFYLLVTLVTPAEGNWAMAGYTTLLALAGWGVIDGMDIWTSRVRAWRAIERRHRPRAGLIRKRPEMPRQLAWHWSIGLGIGMMVFVARVDLLARLPVARDVIPLGRIAGADSLADEVHALAVRAGRDRARNPLGAEPIIVAQHYGRASLLAFYLRDRVRTVYCSSSAMGGRQTQYDFWQDTDLSDLDGLGGRPGVLLGGTRRAWSRAFESVSEPIELVHEPKEDRRTFLGFGYRGFGPRDAGDEP